MVSAQRSLYRAGRGLVKSKRSPKRSEQTLFAAVQAHAAEQNNVGNHQHTSAGAPHTGSGGDSGEPTLPLHAVCISGMKFGQALGKGNNWRGRTRGA